MQVVSQSDSLHEGHATEEIETVRDNPVEHSVTAYCLDCDVTFVKSQTWIE